MNYGRLSKAAAAWVLLLIAGCQSSPPPGWQYDGADPANTRFISVWGPALRSGWQWRRAWQAEDFLPLQFQLNPLTRNLEYRVLTADIDGDAEQEIALAAPGGMSGILDCHGVLRRAFDAGERLSSLNADEPGPLSPVTCGPGEVRIYQPSLLPGPDSAGAGLFRSVTTEGTPVQAELLGESGNRAARKRSDSGASDPDPELLVTV